MTEAEYRATLEAIYIDRPHHIDVMVAAWKAERNVAPAPDMPVPNVEPVVEGSDPE